MSTALKLEEKLYTYADYLQWDEKERFEILDGYVYAMTAPLINHQRISRELAFALTVFLKDKPCEVFIAPTTVRLNPQTKDDTVFEPDLFVVCDRKKLDDKACNGAPDLVIEITSPSSISYDCILKYRKYLQAKVREYWIFDPESKVVNAFVLRDDNYIASIYDENDKLPSKVLEGFILNLSEVFGVMEE